MKKNILWVVVLLMLIMPLAACGQNESQRGLPESSSATEADAAGNTGKWDLAIDTVDLYGTEVATEDFANNNLTILNIWGTWCPPCIRELPELQKVSDAFAEQNIQVVGVLQDGVTKEGAPDEEIIQKALMLLEDSGASYTVILPDETLTAEFISTLQNFPTTFFIDETGTVIHTVVGAKNFEGWSKEIDVALKKMS